jgi:hypothetical protein
MNIEKLAKHLKEFTIDEIEMIAECDCKTELEQLLNEDKIVFEQDLYKYKESEQEQTFDLFVIPKNKITPIKIEDAVAYFMKEYVKEYCKFETYRNYRSIFNFNILPFLKGKFLNNISIKEIKTVYNACKMKGLKPRRIKNTMALLNQLIKYFQNLGIIERTCNFQVKRLTDKNQFSINRIIFEV